MVPNTFLSPSSITHSFRSCARHSNNNPGDSIKKQNSKKEKKNHRLLIYAARICNMRRTYLKQGPIGVSHRCMWAEWTGMVGFRRHIWHRNVGSGQSVTHINPPVTIRVHRSTRTRISGYFLLYVSAGGSDGSPGRNLGWDVSRRWARLMGWLGSCAVSLDKSSSCFANWQQMLNLDQGGNIRKIR